MNLTRRQIIIIGIAVLILIVIVLVFIFGLGKKEPAAPEVKLTVFGLDNRSDFQDSIDSYEALRRNVKISYYQIPENNYEKTLIDALAAGRGPDIFFFKNSWLPKHIDKVLAAPETIMPLVKIQELFPKVVEQDFIKDGKTFALPLYIDTLALFYNKDSFDAKGIALLPKTWQEFQELVPKLREFNEQNQIIKAAAAIGGSEKSINKAADILNLILMQLGNPESGSSGELSFNQDALTALNFYTQFANPENSYYTWNDNLEYSVDGFSEGQTIMMFNYLSAVPIVKSKNPFLNFGIMPAPKMAGGKTLSQADYWGLAVSKQSENPGWAWDFILNLTASENISEAYLEAKAESPALRTLINKYLTDPGKGVFSEQALTARSWPKPDEESVRQIFSNAIESVLSGRLSPSQAIEETRNQINSLK